MAGLTSYLQVSPNDPRYLQWSDGSTWVHLGVQGDDGGVMSDPYQADQKLATWASRNVSLLRIFQSAATLVGSAWGPWAHPHLAPAATNLQGNPNLVVPSVRPTLSTGLTGRLAMQIDPTIASPDVPAISWGYYRGLIPCETGTTYQLTLTGRIINGGTGGMRVRFGGKADNGYGSTFTGIGTPYVTNNGAWQTVTGSYTTGAAQRFFEYIYVAFDAGITGSPLGQVAEVRIRKDLGGGNFGPDILWPRSADMHKEYPAAPAAGWRYALQQAAANGLACNLVALDKDDPVWSLIQADGTYAKTTVLTAATMTNSGPTVTVGTTTPHYLVPRQYVSITGAAGFTSWAPNDLQQVSTVTDATHFTFVTNNGTTPTGTYTANSASITVTPMSAPVGTANRWYQAAAARRLAALQADSLALHSVELVNEAGQSSPDAYDAAGAFAKAHHAADSVKHLVTGSYSGDQPFRPDLRARTEAAQMDTADIHHYTSTGFSGQGYEWDPPTGTTLETNTANTRNGSAGAIKVVAPFGLYGPSTGNYIKGQGTWTVSVWISGSGLTGTAGPRMQMSIDNPSISTTNTTTTAATGTYAYTQVTGTFALSDAAWHQLTLSFDTSGITAGTVWFDDLVVTDPNGKVWRIYGSGSFDDRYDLYSDTGYYADTLGKLYGAKSVQGAGKPLIRGEAGIDARGGPNSAEVAALANDTKGVWLHCLLWGALAAGGLYDTYFWSGSSVLTNNLWFHYAPIKSFLAGIPLQNGKYVDIAATPTGQTNGSVVVVGQKDTTNNKAHLWIRHNKFTWNNAVNAPTSWLPGGVAGQILTGTVRFSGLLDGTYVATLWEFDAAGLLVQSSQNVSCVSSIIALNLTALRPTTTDVAISLAPYVAPGGGGGGGGGGVVQTVAGPINFDFEIRDSTGALVTGLIPTVQGGKVLDDAGNLVSFPNPTEISQTYAPGWYRSPFDLIASGAVGDVVGTILTTLAAPRDKIPFKITRETFRLVNNLDAQVSRVPVGTGAATPGQGDTSGAPATPVWGKH